MENAGVAFAPKDARERCSAKRADGKYVCDLCTTAQNQLIILGCTRTPLVMEATKRHLAKAPWFWIDGGMRMHAYRHAFVHQCIPKHSEASL
eukprot:363565-Chlamydomonas_euryale.AAC.16